MRTSVKSQDFYAFVSAMADALRNPRPPRVERPSPRIRLRGLSASALGREVAVERADSREDPRAVIARTYASAIVIMRRFLEAMRKGRYELPQRVKRVAQRLVDLSAGETPAFLGVTSVRNQNHDDAGRAANTAILAVAMARQVDEEPIVQLVARAAMARRSSRTARAPASPGIVGGRPRRRSSRSSRSFKTTRCPRARPWSPSSAASAGVNGKPSTVRTVLTSEAHWVRREKRLGPLYRGLRTPTLQARIVATARAFNDRVTPNTGETPVAADEAIESLEREANDNVDRTVLRLLVGALGLFPTGTLVELSTGEVALVVHTPTNPAQYSQPKVRVVLDASGASLPRPIEIDLAQRPRQGEPPRHIRRVVADDPDDPGGGGAARLGDAIASRTPRGSAAAEQAARAATQSGGRSESNVRTGSGVHSGELSAMTPHSSEASRAPLSSPWTPSPGSVSSGHHSIVRADVDERSRPRQPRGLARDAQGAGARPREGWQREHRRGRGARRGRARGRRRPRRERDPRDVRRRPRAAPRRTRDRRRRDVAERSADRHVDERAPAAHLRSCPTAAPDLRASRATVRGACRRPTLAAHEVRQPRALRARGARPPPARASRRRRTASTRRLRPPAEDLHAGSNVSTGSTVFKEPSGVRRTVVFDDGAPAKIRSRASS